MISGEVRNLASVPGDAASQDPPGVGSPEFAAPPSTCRATGEPVRGGVVAPLALGLDTAPTLKQVLRAVSGAITAFGGYSTCLDWLKSRLFRQQGASLVGVADVVALCYGLLAMVLAVTCAIGCTTVRELRPLGMAATTLLAIFGLFAVKWTGSETWLWLGPVALLWCCFAGLSSRNPRNSKRWLIVACLGLVGNATAMYNGLSAPSLSLWQPTRGDRHILAGHRLQPQLGSPTHRIP